MEQTTTNQDDIKWKEMETNTLVDKIKEQFHEKHRHDFPILTELAQNVMAQHRDHPLCPKGLLDRLETMFEELEMHMQKEEQMLFPLLIASNPMAAMPISVMKSEHEQVNEDINKLRETCHDFKLPEDACPSWKTLYNGLEHLIAELQNHINVENDILFNRI